MKNEKFAEFEKEIFALGDYGDKGKYTEKELDQLVANYDPAFLEAPIVLDHSQAEGQSYGWVESIRREGDKLIAKFRQVSDDFIAMMKEGRYKKNSVELYTDLNGKGLYLKRVAFLGAAIPHVKGLADAAFSFPEGDTQTITFDISELVTINQEKVNRILEIAGAKNIREALEYLETLNRIQWQSNTNDGGMIPMAEPKDQAIDTQTPQDSQVDFAELKEKAKQEAEKEFAEKLAEKDRKIAEMEKAKERDQMIAFTEKLAIDGKLPPAILGGGKSGKAHLADVLLAVPSGEVAFDENTVIDPRKELMSRFETLGQVAIFNEIAPSMNDKKLPEGADFDAKVKFYCEENDLDFNSFEGYKQAANFVASQED